MKFLFPKQMALALSEQLQSRKRDAIQRRRFYCNTEHSNTPILQRPSCPDPSRSTSTKGLASSFLHGRNIAVYRKHLTPIIRSTAKFVTANGINASKVARSI